MKILFNNIFPVIARSICDAAIWFRAFVSKRDCHTELHSVRNDGGDNIFPVIARSICDAAIWFRAFVFKWDCHTELHSVRNDKRIINFTKDFVVMMTVFLSFSVHAQMVDEQPIYTVDKSCRMNYMSTQSRKAWSINIAGDKCRDGLVHGYTVVDIKNPFGQETEQMVGYFSYGYWTGDFPELPDIIARSTPEENTQSLSFTLGQDRDVRFIGQVRSTRASNKIYGPFMGCHPFRVLAVVSDATRFRNPEFQGRLMDMARRYAAQYCPREDRIFLFGSSYTSPQLDQVAWFSDMDLKTGQNQMQYGQMTPNVDQNTAVPESGLSDDAVPLPKPVPVPAPSTPVPVVTVPPLKTMVVTENLPSSVNHLLLTSKMLGIPVEGRAAVHVHSTSLDGTGVVDVPLPLHIVNSPRMEIGWAMVVGTFTGETNGPSKVRISSFVPCQKERCIDVP